MMALPLKSSDWMDLSALKPFFGEKLHPFQSHSNLQSNMQKNVNLIM